MGPVWSVSLAAAVFAAALSMVLFTAGPLWAQLPTPTPGGDCCAFHLGPGCDLPDCEACVCEDAEQPFCCAVLGMWDGICAQEAAGDLCASACLCGEPTPLPTPTPGGDCCSAHGGTGCDDTPCTSCVCGIDETCCDNVWDAFCVSIARGVDECASSCPCEPDPTPPPGPTPTPAPCCEPHDLNPGCAESECEACVCGVDEVCCSDTWDASCVSIADDECALDCMCIDLGDCCEDHGGPGCNVGICQDCVIALDPACAESWDADCASEAMVECALDCPCGDCCAAQDQVGCGQKSCQACVCDIDDTCCGEVWDAFCESIAEADCSLACPCGDCCAEQEVPGCGVKTCQTCVCALDTTCCGDVWDGICADRAATECAGRCDCEPVSDCCVEREGEAGCTDSACEACVCGIDSFCCDDFWDQRCAEDLARSPECGAVCACGGGSGCVGDCDGDGSVSVGNLITGVNISLGRAALSVCAVFDANGNGSVSVAELIQGVRNALDGCP